MCNTYVQWQLSYSYTQGVSVNTPYGWVGGHDSWTTVGIVGNDPKLIKTIYVFNNPTGG